MADNSLRTPGTGETIASDDIGGVKWQRVKIGVGADGVANDILVPADAMTAANAGIMPAAPELFNETTFDRMRGNTQGTLLASAARTTSTNSPNQTNYNARGVAVFLFVTAKAAATTLDLFVYGVDPASGNNIYYTKHSAFAAPVGGGLYFIVYPGLVKADMVAGGAGTSAVNGCAAPLPRTWGVQVSPSDANSVTYSVSYSLIV